MSVSQRFFGISLLVLAFFSVSMPFTIRAAELRVGEQPSIGADERITEDVYIAGGNVSSAGVAIADLVAAGGNVLIRGGVGGDLMAAGGSLTILGNVADDLRAAGGNILLQGSVGGDAVLAGGELNIGGAGLKGDLLAGGGTIRVDAPVGGSVRVAGGDVYLNSAVSGNVEVHADTLTLGKSARIKGNLTYSAGKEATVEEGAVVSGDTTFKPRKEKVSAAGIATIVSFAVFGTFLSHLASALLFGLVFRRYALTIVTEVVAQPFIEVGRGLIIFIVLPVASLMLFFTLLGIPLGIFGLLSFAGIMIFLWIVTPILLGSIAYRFFSQGTHEVNWKTILLGVFLYSVIGLVPFAGWLVQYALCLATLGAAAKLKWSIAKEWR